MSMFDIQEVKKNVVKWTSTKEGQTNEGQQEAISKPATNKPATAKMLGAAVIGPSIHIEGQLTGEEALIIEGRVEGTIDLKNNDLTIGSNGIIKADVFANTIRVEGELKGDLHGKERVHISKTGKVTGNIFSARVSIEDGARFRGSIDMEGKDQQANKNISNSNNSGSNTPGSNTGLKRA